ncbi:glycosyltransferase [Vibrio diabolicus]|uniref:glycosyltransferase n=1 Tax=Vibrio diabolicus TaxID=50719 RepID=UPI00375255C7
MNNCKIAVVILPSLYKFGWMGSTKRYLSIVLALKKLGYEVRTIAQPYEDREKQVALESELSNLGDIIRVGPKVSLMRILRFPLKIISPTIFNYLVSTLWARLVVLDTLLPKAEIPRVEFIWAMSGQSLDAAVLARRISEKYNIPWVYELHDPPIGADIVSQNELISRQHKNLLDKSSFIITNANSYKNLIVEHYKIPEKKIINIYLKIKSFKESNFESNRLNIGYFGSLSSPRNMDFLADCSLFKSNSFGFDIKLHLAGQGDGFASLQKKFDDRLVCHSKYSFYGLINSTDVESYLSLCDAVIMVQSDVNALQVPGKVFELLSYQKPIIYIMDGYSETSEILSNSGVALLVKNGDLGALDDAVESVLKFKNGELMLKSNKEYASKFLEAELPLEISNVLNKITCYR